MGSSFSFHKLLKYFFAKEGNDKLFFLPNHVSSSILLLYQAKEKAVDNTSFLR